jgi:hypothetical protein
MTLGEAEKNTIYINNNGVWTLFDFYEGFRILKRQNQVSEFEFKIYDIQDSQKAYFKEQAEVLFFSGTTMILKGRIQTIEYGSEYEVIARGNGMEVKLMDKEFMSSVRSPDDPKRVEYTNVSAQTIAKELLSINSTGSAPWTMTPASNGIFSSDYGQVSMRYEYANKLNALGALSKAIDYDWWVNQTSSDDYDEDYFNIASVQGLTTSAKTFSLTGTGSNATRTSREKDVSNMANYVSVLGYGDGENQLKTTTYAASTQSSYLSANITSSASTTISLLDATSFPSSGTVRIAEEIINYAGKSGNDLTGSSRGVSGSTAATHLKGNYAEVYYPSTSPQTGSSIQTYGLIESTQIDRSIIDRETAELVATGFLKDHSTPIERIKIIPNEPYTDVALLNIGDLITINDAEAGINNESYRIVGIEYIDDYGNLSMEIEVSNVSLEFIEKMQAEKQQNQDLQKYMQGATNIYSLNNAENCDSSHPLNVRFYIPEEAVAINKVLLNFKKSNYRAYNTSINAQNNSAAAQTPFVDNGTDTTITTSWTNLNNISFTSPDFSDFSHAFVYGNMTADGAYVPDGFYELAISVRIYNSTDGEYYPNSNGIRAYTVNSADDKDSQGYGIWFFDYWIYLPKNLLGKNLTLQARIEPYGDATSVRVFSAINKMAVGYHTHSDSLVYGIYEDPGTGYYSIYENKAPDYYDADGFSPGHKWEQVFQNHTIPTNFSPSHLGAHLHNGNSSTSATVVLYLKNTTLSGSYYVPTGSMIASTSVVTIPGYYEGWVSGSLSPSITLTNSSRYAFGVSCSSIGLDDLFIDFNHPETPLTTGAAFHDGVLNTSYSIPYRIYGTGNLVNVSVGSEGSETLVGVYREDQTNIDVTNYIGNAGNWYNIQFSPHNLMRIDANAYVKVFIQSK